VRAIETTLLEDYGTVDRQLIRRNLLTEPGITGVFYGPGDHSLRIEYDPAIVAGEKLLEILCRHGVSDEVVPPPPDLKGTERWIEILKDGRRVLIRPIRPSDVARNATFIEKLSPPSKHYLFLGGIAQLSDVALRRLCDPDYAQDMAYIALALDVRTGEARDQVGVCRYAGGDPLNAAQNLSSAYGKIFRIDPVGRNGANGKYGVPASNPFAANQRPGALPEVYAYGVRNPQRFGWDPANGTMYVADIGQNIVEEISPVTAGANLGWNVWEASFRYAGRVKALHR